MKFVNWLMNVLLRSPLHLVVSRQIMLITFTGRKTGRTYTTPVEYRRAGNTITFMTWKSRNWWRNLESGAPVTLRIQGQDMSGTPTILPATAADLRRLHPRMSEAWIARSLPDVVLVQVDVQP